MNERTEAEELLSFFYFMTKIDIILCENMVHFYIATETTKRKRM